jgi:hypothetical protein
VALIEKREGEARVRGVERSFEVQLGPLGGFDLRPTRFFVWSGAEREGRERELRAGAVRVRSLGNPLMTAALAGVHAARKISDTRRQRELDQHARD